MTTNATPASTDTSETPANQPHPAPPKNRPTVTPSLTPQVVNFANKTSVSVLYPPPEATASEITTALQLKQPAAVFLVLGSTDGLDELGRSHLIQLISRGIARAAAEMGAALIDHGLGRGLAAVTGQGVADRGRKSPLIGVAPASLVSIPSGKGQAAPPNAIDPNHTHFVLTEGDEWGDETALLFELVEQLSEGKPVAVSVLVNGDESTRKQLLQSVRRDWPVVIIQGSGGLADELAALWQSKPAFIPDPDLAEIVVEGNLHTVALDGQISAFERLLDQITHYQEGGKMDTLELAWKTFAELDANANRQQATFHRLQSWTLGLGVLGTLLVLIEQQMQISGIGFEQTFANDILYFIILLVPISVTFLIALNNRFSAGSKWILSRAGAESIKKEIYRYRARAEIYSDANTVKLSRDLKLTRKIEAISTKLMQTEVNTSAISDYNGPIPPKYGAADGDDGLSFLPPDRYLNYRLQDQLKYYRRKTVEFERQLKRLQWFIYGAGALGTLLVALRLELWIALTTAVVTALTTFLEYRKVEEKLMRYNQTATDLANVQSWWTALSAEEQSSPDNIDKLVAQTETTIHAEHAAWVQVMQDALAELRAEQSKDNKDQEGGQSTEQKLIANQG